MHPLIAAVHLLTASTLTQTPDLSFKADAAGQFTFDTGVVRGRLTADREQQGLTSLVDVKTGRELTAGRRDIGLFTYYRFLSTDHRWGDVGWKFPKRAERTDDGAVRIVWPASPALSASEGVTASEHPFELTAVYKWTRPDALDVETTITPRRDLPKFELFVGSYFAEGFHCKVYLKPGRYAKGEPQLVPADVNPLTEGLYYAFPRDLAAAQLVFDGRWLRGHNPVDWAVTRYLAGGLAVQEDAAAGIACVLMSRPEECAIIYASYNRPTPDSVSSHHSTYLGLFGRDLKAGQPVRTTSRLAVTRNLRSEDILERYQQFGRQ